MDITRRFVVVFGCSNRRTRMYVSMNKPQSRVENKLLGKCRASACACDSCVVLVCKRAWRTAHSAVNSVALRKEGGRRGHSRGSWGLKL